MKVRPIVGKQAFSDDTFAPNHYEKINMFSGSCSVLNELCAGACCRSG